MTAVCTCTCLEMKKTESLAIIIRLYTIQRCSRTSRVSLRFSFFIAGVNIFHENYIIVMIFFLLYVARI